MRIERERANVFTVTATSQELSVLVAAARMSPAHPARQPERLDDSNPASPPAPRR